MAYCQCGFYSCRCFWKYYRQRSLWQIVQRQCISGSQFFAGGWRLCTTMARQSSDMLYFPLIEGHFPQWFPFWKGEEFLFFRPVFNIADSSITIGVALILIFQKKFFKGLKL